MKQTRLTDTSDVMILLSLILMDSGYKYNNFIDQEVGVNYQS